MERTLYRSRSQRILGGVCGGLAAYLKIDATLIRLLFVLLALNGGVGGIIYLLLWVILPLADGDGVGAISAADDRDEISSRFRALGGELQQSLRDPNPKATLFVGGGLIVVGSILLLEHLNLSWLWWLKSELFWPLILILGGIALIWRRTRR